MKKTLEDELMSLAHRILQLRGRENLDDLQQAARELYEKLTILVFTENHFKDTPSPLKPEEVQQALEKDTPPEQTAPTSPSQPDKEAYSFTPNNSYSTVEKKPEQEKAVASQAPAGLNESGDNLQENTKNPSPQKRQALHNAADKDLKNEVDLGDIAVNFDDLPEFEPANTPQSITKQKDQTETQSSSKPATDSKKPAQEAQEQEHAPTPNLFSAKPKTKNDLSFHQKSLNERLNNGLKFGLNDRLAFINQLFEGNATDFNRVISQLNTFQNFEEAQQFIAEQVKPDYNWQAHPISEERFLKSVENNIKE